MAYCLPKFFTQKFITALKDGTVDPVKLSEMTSAERHSFFEGLIGKENAAPVNALFESKLLLKNQQAGLINWAKKTGGLKESARRDIVSRIQKMEKVLDAKNSDAFLNDLASQKLGTTVTFEEAKKIVDLTRNIEQSKAKIKPNEPDGSPNRLEYGLQVALLKDSIGELKLKNNIISLRNLRDIKTLFKQAVGISKSILSTLDNSFFGRQGIKMLMDPMTTKIWTRNFIKSWGDFKKELMGQDASIPIKADVYSRANAINGKYQAMDVAIGLATEEAYPNSIPTHIPVLGRLFKASETAYNGAALRIRADYADMIIKTAESNGLDLLTDPVNAKGLGQMINSSTGRGPLYKAEVFAKELNLYLFSPKFLMSNVDTLLAPLKIGTDLIAGKEITYARKQAAYKTLRVIGTMASVLATTEALNPGSVEVDPRSSHFGKVKLGDRWFDITGGMSSLTTLVARSMPTQHNGKWGFWTKGPTGKYTQLSSGKYGSLTPVDYLTSFAQGKLSPPMSTLVTLWKQKDFQGNKPTLTGIGKNLIVPLPVQTFEQLMKDPNGANILSTMILEELGFSSQAPQKK